MMISKEEKFKLILLGHSEVGVGLMTDLVNESFGISQFDVVKNIDLPDCQFVPSLYDIHYFSDREYDFEANKPFMVQFGVQQSHIRFILFQHFNELGGISKEDYLSVRHRLSYVAPSASYQGGVLIEPMAVVSSFSRLGFGVSVKRSASVGHHASLGDFVSINPAAVLSGYVEVGEGSEIGSGAVISNNIKIGKRSLIGAGSVVTKDIPDGVIAYGNPCKVVKENSIWKDV